jgi:glucose dehydrogenase
VGNGGPWNHTGSVPRVRATICFLSSIVALDPDTGAYKWHYQENPGESWDFDATQPMILATFKIDGKERKVLMQAPKNGFFYVIDRTNGQLISAKNFVPMNWASGVDMSHRPPDRKSGGTLCRQAVRDAAFRRGRA